MAPLGSVISKCMLSRALLLHTIEKSLCGVGGGGVGVAAVSQDHSSDSFAAEVEQNKNQQKYFTDR